MDVSGLYVGLEDRNSLAVLVKLSNLLIHESVPLLGFEDQLELIESKLRQVAGGDYQFWSKKLGDIVYDIEEVIDSLATIAGEKREYIGLFAFLIFVLGSDDVRAIFGRGMFLMCCALALNDLIHQDKLKRKLDEISSEIFSARRILRGGGSWRGSLPKELESSETIISPVLNKVMVLSNQADLSPAVRNKARKLRDNFTVLRVCLNYLESKELSEHGMSWVEKICDVSRSAEDAISLFMYGREGLSKSLKVHNFLNVFSAFDNFNSQKKLSQELDRINKKLEDIVSSRTDEDLIASKFPKRIILPFEFDDDSSSSEYDPFDDDKGEDVKLPEQNQLKFPGQLVSNLQEFQVTKPLLTSTQVEQTQRSTMSSPDDATIDDDNSSSDDDIFDDDEEDQITTPMLTSTQDEQTQQSTTSSSDAAAIEASLSSSGNDNRVDTTGFEHDVDDILEVLLNDDPNCHTISIVGIEGVGQKEVAKLVYEHPATRNHFLHRVWVPTPTFDDLIEQIVGVRIGLGYYHQYRYAYLHLLNQFFKAKKYLIIIDKVFTTSLWNDIHEAFDGLSNGTRVVFITYYEPFYASRGQRLTPEVSERNSVYRMHLRDDDESWTLFTRSLKMNIHPDLLKLKREILRRCGGLPIVIEKLAGQLSEKVATTEEWSSVLEQLTHDKEPWKEALYKIKKTLPLYLRRCLFYFGLFPQDLEVPTRRLIALWVAEGLGRRKGDEESPESVSEECLMELADENVIQVAKTKLNGKIKTCRLPYALRVHWLSKAKEASFLPGNNCSPNDSSSIIRRLADHLDSEDPSYNDIHGNGNTSRYSRYRDVISFLSFDSREEIKAAEDLGNFLNRCISNQSFHFLWVLDLERVYQPKLPKALGQLIRLRYFGLRSTYLVMLPLFINKLLSLQTLDLKRTHISTLPSSIWKMNKLRHLFLDDSSRTIFLPQPKGSSSLVDLQTLWCAYLDEESPVKNGLDTLLNIKKLGLTCRITIPSRKEAMSLQLDAIANWISSLKQLQSFRLKSFDESNRPWNLHLDSLSDHVDLYSVYLAGKLKNQQLICKFPKNLIELTLSASGLAEDPMQILDKLPNLKILILLLGSFTGKKMLCRFGGFLKLEVLKLKKLMQLEEWNVDGGALPCLKDLEIESCSSLKMLPDGLRLVRTLREVTLAKLPMISSRIKDNKGEEWNKIAHVRNVCLED